MISADFKKDVRLIDELDNLGAIYGLYRYEEESLENFRERISNLYRIKAAQDTNSLSHQISLDLGYNPISVAAIVIDNENLTVSKKPICLEKDKDGFKIRTLTDSTVISYSTLDPWESSSVWWLSEALHSLDSHSRITTIPLIEEEDLRLLRSSQVGNFMTYNPWVQSSIRNKVSYLGQETVYQIKSQGNILLNEVESIEKEGDYIWDKSKNTIEVFSIREPQIIYVSTLRSEEVLRWWPVSIHELSNEIYVDAYMRTLSTDLESIDIKVPSSQLMKYMFMSMNIDGYWNQDNTLLKSATDINNRYIIGDALDNKIREAKDSFYQANYENIRRLIGG